MTLSVSDVVKIAKRVNNSQRDYLLVNPLQAKHIPVSPSKSLRMMREVADKIAPPKEASCAVIAFAETATAIGAAVASSLGPNSSYLQTTREDLGNAKALSFTEDHSHAVNQSIDERALAKILDDSNLLLIVDDEFSTGKTLTHAVGAIKDNLKISSLPEIRAVSVVNRMSEEDRDQARKYGISFLSAVQIAPDELVGSVSDLSTQTATPPGESQGGNFETLELTGLVPDPRFGTISKEYEEACLKIAQTTVEEYGPLFARATDILVLGTEECMYPALIMGALIESNFSAMVFAHATTRSPIGICQQDGYPIANGTKLRSFYDSNRTTYLYNLRRYDLAIVVTDAIGDIDSATADLSSSLMQYGCPRMILVRI